MDFQNEMMESNTEVRVNDTLYRMTIKEKENLCYFLL